MLKKLVKYGNSSALIFDKAILELLGISEGSLLKIQTDGKSLTLTPYSSPVKEEKIHTTVTYDDAILASLYEFVIKQYPGLSLERIEVLSKELQALHGKRKAIGEKLPAYNDFVHRVHSAKHVLEADKYGQEYIKLRDSMVPELISVDDQILNFEENHNLPRLEKGLAPTLAPRGGVQGEIPSNLDDLMKEYTELYQGKYRLVCEKLKMLEDNPDYINEKQLFLEKSGGKFDLGLEGAHAEFLQALRYKYVPEARAMDEETIAIGKKITYKKAE